MLTQIVSKRRGEDNDCENQEQHELAKVERPQSRIIMRCRSFEVKHFGGWSSGRSCWSFEMILRWFRDDEWKRTRTGDLMIVEREREKLGGSNWSKQTKNLYWETISAWEFIRSWSTVWSECQTKSEKQKLKCRECKQESGWNWFRLKNHLSNPKQRKKRFSVGFACSTHLAHEKLTKGETEKRRDWKWNTHKCWLLLLSDDENWKLIKS